jgi:hypothetical protein
LGISTGSGTLGLNYTGNSGKWDGSFDVIERQAGTGNLSAELNYGEDGFSVSGNADLGNGLGFGLENGRSGMSGSLTILGSTQGTVGLEILCTTGLFEAYCSSSGRKRSSSERENKSAGSGLGRGLDLRMARSMAISSAA